MSEGKNLQKFVSETCLQWGRECSRTIQMVAISHHKRLGIHLHLDVYDAYSKSNSLLEVWVNYCLDQINMAKQTNPDETKQAIIYISNIMSALKFTCDLIACQALSPTLILLSLHPSCKAREGKCHYSHFKGHYNRIYNKWLNQGQILRTTTRFPFFN